MTKIQTQHAGKFTGIVQLALADTSTESSIVKLQNLVLNHPDIKPRHSPITKLHVTLLHQSYPKKFKSPDGPNGKKLLSNAYKAGEQMGLDAPSLTLDDVYLTTEGEKESTYVRIAEQNLCETVRNQILAMVGITPEALGIEEPESSRVYHISLTNLTGNAGDSAKYPQSTDQRILSASEYGGAV